MAVGGVSIVGREPGPSRRPRPVSCLPGCGRDKSTRAGYGGESARPSDATMSANV